MEMKYFVNARSINSEEAKHFTYGPFETFEDASKWMSKYVKQFIFEGQVAECEEVNNKNFGHEFHLVTKNSITMRFEVAEFSPAWTSFK